MKFIIKSIILATAMVAAANARAEVDGCKLLLCLAGNWQDISECVPTVKQAFNDANRGRPFPACNMAGEGNSVTRTATTELTCPPAYVIELNNGNKGCLFNQAVVVRLNGEEWSTVYLGSDGSTSTRYAAAARGQTNDPSALRFQADAAAFDAKAAGLERR